MFDGIFSTGNESIKSIELFLLCVGVALFIGVLYLLAYSFKSRSSSSFKMALALLPAVVAVVIMMVNGNIGVGVAVAGAFSLVRFRSATGTAKEICVIFMAMCSGLIVGVGYLAYAILFTLIMGILLMLINYIVTKESMGNRNRLLKITIPEDLDYPEVFDNILTDYTIHNELVEIKTTNMGSLYKLTYEVTLKKDVLEKNFIDQLRQRNGNLEISLLRQERNERDL